MANASLQIGNGNWAIKEDNLLGYSKSGTRFLPIPITMTRATLGTRVNPSGLIEDVELLGDELVSCGDFDCADPDAVWNRGTGWTISNGKATLVAQAGSSSLGSVVMSVTSGKTYKVTVNVSATSTGFRLYDTAGVVSYGLQLGENVFYTIPSSSSYQITPLGLAGASGIIDNVSVKEATIDGLARVDYTDGTASLLVEPQRTNLITYSEDASQWINDYSVTITTNSETSPNGLVDADKIEFTQDGSLRPNNTQLTFVDNYNYSIFVKKGNSRYITLQANFFTTNSTIGFDLDTATAQSGGIIEDYGNDWFRLSITKNVTGDADRTGAFYIYSPNTLGSASSVAGNYLYVWGAQVEEGSYATSYIKTQGSTVTRNQDEYSKTGISDKINSEEGVFFVEMAALSDDGTNRIITLSDGSYNNSIRIAYYINTNEIEIRLVVGGVIQVLSRVNIGNVLIFNKIALKYKANDFALWVNGTEIYSLSSGSTYASETLNRLAFDDTSPSYNFFGKVKQLQIFKTALSDSELATLTT